MKAIGAPITLGLGLVCTMSAKFSTLYWSHKMIIVLPALKFLDIID